MYLDNIQGIDDVLSSPSSTYKNTEKEAGFTLEYRSIPSFIHPQKPLHIEDPDDPTTWSSSHRFPLRSSYRNSKRSGPWSEEEKQFFIQMLKQGIPSDGQWGEFSELIPGRAGYQCKAFYEKLVSSGQIQLSPLASASEPKLCFANRLNSEVSI